MTISARCGVRLVAVPLASFTLVAGGLSTTAVAGSTTNVANSSSGELASLPSGELASIMTEGCAYAAEALVEAVHNAFVTPNATNIAAVAYAAAKAILECKSPNEPPPGPGEPGGPPYDQEKPPPRQTPRFVPTAPQNGPDHPCEASFGIFVPLIPSMDPSVPVTLRMDWGDGTTSDYVAAQGATMTAGHNFYYSSTPWPRLYAGANGEPLADGDPEGDGSDFYITTATVLETGATSELGVVEHVGPFYDNASVGGGVYTTN